MQSLTIMDNLVVENYDHMTRMDENVDRMELTDLL